jgi:hypothetical protein
MVGVAPASSEVEVALEVAVEPAPEAGVGLEVVDIASKKWEMVQGDEVCSYRAVGPGPITFRDIE